MTKFVTFLSDIVKFLTMVSPISRLLSLTVLVDGEFAADVDWGKAAEEVDDEVVIGCQTRYHFHPILHRLDFLLHSQIKKLAK